MDIEELIILSLSAWAVICFIATNSVEVYITMLLIGILIVYELGRNFMRKEVKEIIQPIIYIMLLAFAIVVIKRAMEVLK
ncbi:MAG: hypothetical protein QXU31_07805 [Archaeoglobaceae archaeon]